MTWNYRVMLIKHRLGEDAGSMLGIHEVYYDADDKPTGYTRTPIDVACEEDEGVAALRRIS